MAFALNMQKKIQSALISVFYKDGLEDILTLLQQQNVTIYSTGGTKTFIDNLGIPCIAVEAVTAYPEILGGRVKTLHPKIFGGILGKRNDAMHTAEMHNHAIPELDLVIVDLYPFEETVAFAKANDNAGNADEIENTIIEKIDIGGPSMIRAAAKNFNDVVVLASKNDYALLHKILQEQDGETTFAQRKTFAIKAFDVCTHYDNAISSYFNEIDISTPFNKPKTILRYGENPHQAASFFGNLNEIFTQLNGKELSYNNLVDVDAALQLIQEFDNTNYTDEVKIDANTNEAIFAIIKHTNVCGAAKKDTLHNAWLAALAGDPESAFGAVLITNREIDETTAQAISEIFFEVLLAPSFTNAAMQILQQKKNRILLQTHGVIIQSNQSKTLLNGTLIQNVNKQSFAEWKEVGGRLVTTEEKQDLIFANIICKHLKSNAIALVKNNQLIGKGCGQTSRIDALKNAIDKAIQFGADTNGAVLASDAFFPFDDCVRIAYDAGIAAFIQPGGSLKDKDSIAFCKANILAMVLTNTRHFKH